MKIVYELHDHWISYGRPGGTQLDFDVHRGTTIIGRFETREAAMQEIQRLQKEAENRVLGVTVDEEFDEYEIKEIEIPDTNETT